MSLAYRLLRCLFGLLAVLLRSDLSKDAELVRRHENREQAREAGVGVVPRDEDAVLRMFNGRELLDPGLVLVSRWRPENGEPGLDADNVMAHGGVAAL